MYFVEIVYDGVLGLFLDVQEGACRLVFMEDSVPIHRNKVPRIWRENHKIKKLI